MKKITFLIIFVNAFYVIQAKASESHQRFSVSGFGGGGASSGVTINQRQTGFFGPNQEVPFFVNASGDASTAALGMVGGNISYEWSKNDIKSVVPAIELEGYYLQNKQVGNSLHNNNPLSPGNVFSATYPLHAGVFLINGRLNKYFSHFPLSPYIDAGIGISSIAIKNAECLSITPAEPGINHYNSDSDSSDWTFSAQAKAGLAFGLKENLNVLLEYRFLYFAPTQYTFGATVYPNHVPTTNSTASLGSMYNNMATLGLQYYL